MVVPRLAAFVARSLRAAELPPVELGTDGTAARGLAQGFKFRRNFAEIRRKISFSLVTGEKNFGIFRKISFENSKFKKIQSKFAEIYRNFVSAKHRDLQRKRNG